MATEPVEIDGMLCFPKDEAPVEPTEEPKTTLPNCPNDPRFQQANITKWCYQMFIDYQRCKFLLGTKPDCDYFKRCYTAICPNYWVENWEDQIEEGTFPRDLRRDYYYR